MKRGPDGLTHVERIAMALLPKDHRDPLWDMRSRRAALFLAENQPTKGDGSGPHGRP